MRISSPTAFRKWSFYLSTIFSILILFSYQNCGKVKFSVPKSKVNQFNCPAIEMNPSSNLYPDTEIAFTVAPMTNVESLSWDFKKVGSASFLSGNTNPMVYSFDGASEGVGDYEATLTSTLSDGTSCTYSESFQILPGSDLCANPSGISGPSIGYVGETINNFRITFEDCFNGSVAWDMDNDGAIEYNYPDGSLSSQPIGDPVSYEYPTARVYTVRAVVNNLGEDSVITLTHQIDIRHRPCPNGAINPPECTTCPTGQTMVGNQCVSYTYAWSTSAWSACSATACGTTGTQTRTAVCKRNDATTVADSFCNANPKPTTSRSCSAPACPSVNGACGTTNYSCVSGILSDIPDSSTHYLWNCLGSNGGTTAYCSLAKPVIYNYSWDVGSFGACSATACGTSGTQTRSVVCRRDDGVAVQDIFCTTAKPSTTQSCSAPACPYTYSWISGAWSECSATACGTSGTQTRSVVCTRNDGVGVADSFCSNFARPTTSQACSAPACGVCEWVQDGETTYTPEIACDDGLVGSGPIRPPYACTTARNGERYAFAGCKNTNLAEAVFDCVCQPILVGDCNCSQYTNSLCVGAPGANGGCTQTCNGGQTIYYDCK